MKTFDIPCLGYSVKADWYEGKTSEKILLVLIGWTSSRAAYKDLLSSIVAGTGMSALVFDYSGHGDSPLDINKTRPAQHFLEAIEVFDQLTAKHPQATISVMGTSYGGYLATQLTKYRAFDNLVLRVPAMYKPEDFYTISSKLHANWDRYAFRTDKAALAKHTLLLRASNFKGKTMVVIHELDEQVPHETTDAYIEAFHADTYVATGFPHTISNKQSRKDIVAYQKAIINWLTDKTKATR